MPGKCCPTCKAAPPVIFVPGVWKASASLTGRRSCTCLSTHAHVPRTTLHSCTAHQHRAHPFAFLSHSRPHSLSLSLPLPLPQSFCIPSSTSPIHPPLLYPKDMLVPCAPWADLAASRLLDQVHLGSWPAQMKGTGGSAYLCDEMQEIALSSLAPPAANGHLFLGGVGEREQARKEVLRICHHLLARRRRIASLKILRSKQFEAPAANVGACVRQQAEADHGGVKWGSASPSSCPCPQQTKKQCREFIIEECAGTRFLLPAGREAKLRDAILLGHCPSLGDRAGELPGSRLRYGNSASLSRTSDARFGGLLHV